MAQTELKKRANAIAAYGVVDGILTWDFGPIGKVTLNPDKVSAVNRARAMVFGLKQRVADCAALSRDTSTGASATAEEKFAEMKRMAAHLESGSDLWELRAATEGDSPLNIEAIGRALGLSEAGVEGLLVQTEAKRGVDRKGALAIWLATKQVVEAKAAIQAERAAKRAVAAPSADDLMREMLGKAGEDDEAPL